MIILIYIFLTFYKVIVHIQLSELSNASSLHSSPSLLSLFRRGHDDLGDHYLDCGDLSNALKCYSRARDYCTSAKHVINMCLNVIKVRQDDTFWSRNQDIAGSAAHFFFFEMAFLNCATRLAFTSRTGPTC